MKSISTPSLSNIRSLLADLVFVTHVIIFLAFPFGFLIPSNFWPERIEIHFFFCVSLFILFYAWGLIWTIRLKDKVHAICVLDTLMQKLRGYSLFDPRNYHHSFTEELFRHLKIHSISKRSVPGMLLVCIILSGILFILKQNGVVLW